MERIVAQMGLVTNRIAPQVIAHDHTARVIPAHDEVEYGVPNINI